MNQPQVYNPVTQKYEVSIDPNANPFELQEYMNFLGHPLDMSTMPQFREDPVANYGPNTLITNPPPPNSTPFAQGTQAPTQNPSNIGQNPFSSPIAQPPQTVQTLSSPNQTWGTAQTSGNAPTQVNGQVLNQQASTGGNSSLQVRMPDGSMRTFSGQAWADPQLDMALKAGGVPLGPNGQPVQVTQANGGYLFNGQPINQFMGAGLFPGQQAALNGFQGASNPGSYNPSAPTGSVTGGGVNRGELIHDPNDPTGVFDMYGPSQINPINLPENPQIQPYWMNPAQQDLSQVPQTQAQTPQSFDQLEFLLSGQGYPPDVIAKMKAAATDSISRQNASNRGANRIAFQQAGMQNSPGALAVEAQGNRRAGDAQTSAMNQLDVENAQQGLTNLRQGVPLELQRTTTGAEMLNSNALANAGRLFSAMQGNVSNVQQANQQNSNIGTQASANNVSNEINRNSNQAQLNRQGDLYNSGVYENRYGLASGNMTSLINGQNPSSYNNNAAGLGANYQPNLATANTFSNIGQQVLNPTVRTT